MINPLPLLRASVLLGSTLATLLTVGCGSSGSNTNTPEGDTSAAPAGTGADPDKMPAEFFAVCEGKDEAATCEVTYDGRTMAGTCVTPPAESGEKRRVCKPDKLPE